MFEKYNLFFFFNLTGSNLDKHTKKMIRICLTRISWSVRLKKYLVRLGNLGQSDQENLDHNLTNKFWWQIFFYQFHVFKKNYINDWHERRRMKGGRNKNNNNNVGHSINYYNKKNCIIFWPIPLFFLNYIHVWYKRRMNEWRTIIIRKKYYFFNKKKKKRFFFFFLSLFYM